MQLPIYIGISVTYAVILLGIMHVSQCGHVVR